MCPFKWNKEPKTKKLKPFFKRNLTHRASLAFAQFLQALHPYMDFIRNHQDENPEEYPIKYSGDEEQKWLYFSVHNKTPKIRPYQKQAPNKIPKKAGTKTPPVGYSDGKWVLNCSIYFPFLYLLYKCFHTPENTYPKKDCKTDQKIENNPME